MKEQEFKLTVFNPSPDWRWGPVIVPWQAFYAKTHIEPCDLVLRQGDIPLLYQIDDVDPDDPHRKVLVFWLANGILPAQNESSPSTVSVQAKKGQPEQRKDSEFKLDITGYGVKFINSRLEVWFNLSPELDGAEQNSYSGAATTVLLDGQEFLDSLPQFPEFHDIEKRCAQLDFIQLFRPPWESPFYWEAPAYKEFRLSDKPYHIVSSSSGPVRASLTIASEPFPYHYLDPLTLETRQLNCQVYRVISLHIGARHLTEELFVKGIPDTSATQKDFVHLYFIAHYFSYLSFRKFRRLDQRLDISRFESIPDWFTVNNLERPFQGYGFATDRHTRSIANPHPAFPDRPYSLSWPLLPCKSAKCLHLFTRYNPVSEDPRPDEEVYAYEDRKGKEAKYEFECQMGRAWFEFLYKPIWVEVAG